MSPRPSLLKPFRISSDFAITKKGIPSLQHSLARSACSVSLLTCFVKSVIGNCPLADCSLTRSFSLGIMIPCNLLACDRKPVVFGSSCCLQVLQMALTLPLIDSCEKYFQTGDEQ